MDQKNSLNAILFELKSIKESFSLFKPVMTFQEFCKFANLSEDYVRKLHAEGRIPFSRPFGRKLYISREEAIQVLIATQSGKNIRLEKKVHDFLLNSKMNKND